MTNLASSGSFPILYDDSSRTFKVYSTTLSDADTYTVTLSGSIDSGLITKSLIFTVTLVNPCP